MDKTMRWFPKLRALMPPLLGLATAMPMGCNNKSASQDQVRLTSSPPILPDYGLKQKKTWHRYRSAHIELLSDYPQERALQAVRVFERGMVFLNQVLPYKAPKQSEPLLVLLFQDPKEIRTRSANPMSVCTFMVQSPGALHRRPLVLAAGDDTQSMRLHWVHELTHYELYRRYGALPAWLDEGLASYFSSIDDLGDKVMLGTPQRLWRFVDDDKGMRTKKEWTHKRTVVPRAWLMDASELINTDYYQFHTSMAQEKSKQSAFADEAVNYAESWLLIHMLLHGSPEYRSLWKRSIAETGDPLAWGDDLVRRLRQLPPNHLDRSLASYATKVSTDASPIRMPRYPRPQIRIEALSESASIEARSLASAEPEEFLDELALAMQMQHPTVQALRTRAWMQLRAGQPFVAGHFLCKAKAQHEQNPSKDPKQRADLLHLGLWIDVEMRREGKSLACLEGHKGEGTSWANALRQVAHSAEQWHAVTQILGAYGKYQEALESGQQALEQNPTCWACYESLARLSYQVGRPKRAIALQHNAIDWTPDALGTRYLRRQRQELARYAQVASPEP